MTTAPDYVRPVVGWRLWSLAAVEGRMRLASHVSPSVWEPRHELVAACEVRRRDVRRPWSLQPTGHAAPAARCTCGVHAVGRIGLLSTYLPQPNRPYSWMRPVCRQVVGLVSLWGRVVEGGRGWRASHAYPAELWVPGIDGNGAEIREAEAIALDLADYGVPVSVCSGLDAPAVIAALPQSPETYLATAPGRSQAR